MNTVHVADVAGAAWALAQWMAGLGRTEADSLAGEVIIPNDKSKVKEGEGHNLPDLSKKLVAPLFNLVSVTFVMLFCYSVKGACMWTEDFFFACLVCHRSTTRTARSCRLVMS